MIGSEIETLIKLLSRLPGLGPRSARRAVLHLIKKQESLLSPLLSALQNVQDNIVTCMQCGSIDSCNPCMICQDIRREDTVLCVVETMGDLWALERARAVTGRYHVLGGVLSAIDGVKVENLNLLNLRDRCMNSPITEVILAMNVTVEGQTTAHYIMDLLEDTGVKITHLAQGVPIGGELDYLDDGTLLTAIKARNSL